MLEQRSASDDDVTIVIGAGLIVLVLWVVANTLQ